VTQLVQVKEFEKPHYLANFVQATFDALPADELKGAAAPPGSRVFNPDSDLISTHECWQYVQLVRGVS